MPSDTPDIDTTHFANHTHPAADEMDAIVVQGHRWLCPTCNQGYDSDRGLSQHWRHASHGPSLAAAILDDEQWRATLADLYETHHNVHRIAPLFPGYIGRKSISEDISRYDLRDDDTTADGPQLATTLLDTDLSDVAGDL